MDPLISVLVACQGLGALIGSFAAVWSELSYVRAMRDGKIDLAEKAHLTSIGRGLTFGMFLLLISSLAIVVVAYERHFAIQPAQTDTYWTVMLLAVFTVSVSWALAKKHVSHALGSALVFTGWWLLTYVSLGLLPHLTFGGSVAFLVVSAALFYGILIGIRTFVAHGLHQTSH